MLTRIDSMAKRISYLKEKYLLDLDSLSTGQPGPHLQSIDELLLAIFKEGAVWEHAQEQRHRNI